MKGQLVSVLIEGVSTRADRTLKIVMGCQEMTPANGAQLLALVHNVATVYISPSEITTKEIEQADAIEPDLPGKTASQRLRNTLFVLFTQKPEDFKEFDAFYKFKMEKIIDHYKTLLEP